MRWRGPVSAKRRSRTLKRPTTVTCPPRVLAQTRKPGSRIPVVWGPLFSAPRLHLCHGVGSLVFGRAPRTWHEESRHCVSPGRTLTSAMRHSLPNRPLRLPSPRREANSLSLGRTARKPLFEMWGDLVGVPLHSRQKAAIRLTRRSPQGEGTRKGLTQRSLEGIRDRPSGASLAPRDANTNFCKPDAYVLFMPAQTGY